MLHSQFFPSVLKEISVSLAFIPDEVVGLCLEPCGPNLFIKKKVLVSYDLAYLNMHKLNVITLYLCHMAPVCMSYAEEN